MQSSWVSLLLQLISLTQFIIWIRFDKCKATKTGQPRECGVWPRVSSYQLIWTALSTVLVTYQTCQRLLHEAVHSHKLWTSVPYSRVTSENTLATIMQQYSYLQGEIRELKSIPYHRYISEILHANSHCSNLPFQTILLVDEILTEWIRSLRDSKNRCHFVSLAVITFKICIFWHSMDSDVYLE